MKHLRIILFFIIVNGPLMTKSQSDSVKIAGLQGAVEALSARVNAIKPGLSSFLLTGFTNLTYHQDLEYASISRFDHAGFSPIFLWKPSDKLFLEVEFHIEMEGGVHGGEINGGHTHGHGSTSQEAGHEGSTHFDLGYANMVYIIKPGLTFTAGKFLTPIGIFNERYHPTWINPLPVDPIGMGHGGPLPSAELGAQLRGGLQTGISKITYSLYISNGPILNEGATDSENAGKLIYSNFSDNNGNKAVGGRFSYLPFSNSSLEVGLSGQYAGKTGDRTTRFENVNASIYAIDLTYNSNITGLGLLRFSSQYSRLSVGDIMYTNSLEEIENGAPVLYTFDNTSTYYYGALSIRLIQSDKNFIQNSELVTRFEGGKTPEGSKWYSEENRLLLGYTYWLHSRSAFKLAVSLGESKVLYGQFALGF